MFRRGLLLLIVGCLTACSAASAEEAFFQVNLNDLKLTDGELPNYQQTNLDWRVRQRMLQMLPDVQVDEAGEAYLRQNGTWNTVFDWTRIDPVSLAIRVPTKREVTGRLLLPKLDGSGSMTLKFRIPPDSASADAARAFQFAKIEHYERRLRFANPGAAWYRSQVVVARQALGKLSQEEERQFRLISVGQRWNGRQAELDRTYEMFSGGRAISANLQLDRELLLPRGNAVTFEQSVPASVIQLFESGTDIREMAQIRSWSNLPILNEWKRRYPDQDPVDVHRRFWGVELVCPGGGKYVWNEEWRTMESTVFGHPGEPKLPDLAAAPLFPFTHCRFGITFELDGLRSRLELERETK